MQTGKYMSDRLLPKIIKKLCTDNGTEIQAYSDDWVLRLTKNGQTAWVYGYHFDLNGGAASEVANDKVATSLVLKEVDISAVEHFLVRSAANEDIEVDVLEKRLPEGVDEYVLKPLTGSSGKSIHLVKSIDEAVKKVRRSGEAGWTLSPLEDLATEYRIIVLDGKIELVYQKVDPLVRKGLRLFNLGLGAKAKAVDFEEPLRVRLEQLATQVCSVMNLRVAAVDIVQLASEELKVLEVNSGVSFEHYARQDPKNHIIAAKIYEKILRATFDNDGV